tara:strand:+ start:171 stop:734 length:564 start_codon:yes stop_codon:yes gene_type:complete
MVKETEPLKFGTAFSYPFNRAKGLLNFLWVLVPIIGWFALGGYGVRLVQHWIKGEFEELPLFDFNDHLKVGFFMFFKSLPFVIAYMLVQLILMLVPYLGDLVGILIGFLVVPVLTINFFKYETVGAYFDFSKLKYVFENFGDYVVTFLKSIGLGIVFLLMILVLVGLPAGSFTNNIFLADFYRRRVE